MEAHSLFHALIIISTQIIGTHLENEFIDKLKDNDNFHPALNLKIDKKIKIHKFEKLKKN